MAYTGSKLSTATATEWGREQSESGEREMEENGGSDGGSNAHWWWALAAATQFGWGIASCRRGIADSSYMPIKAFAVASLFVGAGASSAIASLKASGIHKVEDAMKVGASIRRGLRVRPRVREE